ncbi:hypothetical protein DAEQUDRAFT_725723 [Daedalea quercina L-15889]|uniref:Uncharacterized protein n=1 Tax=Daedalea quercina L-15889 TaxID=1314783 RepID=A0A165QZ12_9APHY|nr:hypothetical protein DAEQUDRAFT_725723 [Daedalea quercina L-15889]
MLPRHPRRSLAPALAARLFFSNRHNRHVVSLQYTHFALIYAGLKGNTIPVCTVQKPEAQIRMSPKRSSQLPDRPGERLARRIGNPETVTPSIVKAAVGEKCAHRGLQKRRGGARRARPCVIKTAET